MEIQKYREDKDMVVEVDTVEKIWFMVRWNIVSPYLNVLKF